MSLPTLTPAWSMSELNPTYLCKLYSMKIRMAVSSELGGQFLLGNLTNLTLHLLTYIIKTKAGLQNVQIQPEMKSSVQMAGSKVVICTVTRWRTPMLKKYIVLHSSGSQFTCTSIDLPKVDPPQKNAHPTPLSYCKGLYNASKK